MSTPLEQAVSQSLSQLAERIGRETADRIRQADAEAEASHQAWLRGPEAFVGHVRSRADEIMERLNRDIEGGNGSGPGWDPGDDPGSGPGSGQQREPRQIV